MGITNSEFASVALVIQNAMGMGYGLSDHAVLSTLSHKNIILGEKMCF